MAAIILVNIDCPELLEIISDDEGANLIFETLEEADQWCWKNADRIGSSTFRIIDLDD